MLTHTMGTAAGAVGSGAGTFAYGMVPLRTCMKRSCEWPCRTVRLKASCMLIHFNSTPHSTVHSPIRRHQTATGMPSPKNSTTKQQLQPRSSTNKNDNTDNNKSDHSNPEDQGMHVPRRRRHRQCQRRCRRHHYRLRHYHHRCWSRHRRPST